MTEIARRNIIVEYESRSEKFRKDQQQIGKEAKGLRGVFANVRGEILKTVGAYAAVGTAISIFKDAVQTIKELESATKELSSITGLQGVALDKLSRKAIELSANFGTSATDIVNGFALVGSKIPELLESGDALAEVTSQADILSKAAGITLEQAIEALTKSMNQYGVGADKAAEFTDILATSQQRGTARVTSLSEALKNVGSIANAAGLDFQQTNVLLQALAKGGLEGAEAGTKLRGVLSILASSGRKDLNPAFTDLNKIIDTLSKEIKDVEKATKVFGQENAAAALTLIKQRDVVEQLTDKLYDHGNALEQASINTDTLEGLLNKTAAAWDALIFSVDSGEGVISQAVKGFAEITLNLLEMIRAINEGGLDFSSFEAFNRTSDLVASKTGRLILEVDKLKERIQEAFEQGDTVTGRTLQIEALNKLIERQNALIKENADDVKFVARNTIEMNQLIADRNRIQALLNDELRTQKESQEEVTKVQEKEIETLASLQEKLKQAREERKKIAEGDRDSLKANTDLIKSLERRIKFFDIAKESTKDFAKEQADAAKNIRELNIALIENDLEREIARAREAGRQRSEAAKGTDEQIAEQKRLIEVQLIKTLKKLRDDANKVRLEQEKALQEMIRDTFEQTAKEEEDRLAKLDAIAVRDVNRALTARTTAIKEQLRDETISEEEAQIKIAQARIKALEEQIDLTLNDYDLRLQLEQQLVDAQIELQKSLTAATKQEQQERLEAAKSIVDSITQILNVAFEREAERINNSIKLQEDRVNKAREIADKGNAEILQLEEQRLKKLQEQREQAAQKQRALQAIQIAANAALAISNTIATVTGEGAKGGIPGLIAAGVAIAATVAAAIASIQGALSSVPAFREGVDVFQGKGTTTSDSNLVRISKGERVVDAKTNNKLVKLGVNNDNIARVAAIGMEALRMPQISQEVLHPVSKKGNNGGIKDLKKEIRKNTLAIQSLGVSATIDADGFTAKIGKRNKLRERRRKMLR